MIFDFDVEPRERVLVMGHVAPDGDSVSSVLALTRYYKNRGLRARCYFADPLPKNLQWTLRDTKPFDKTADALMFNPEVLVVVDCEPTEKRCHFPVEDYLRDHPNCRVLNIDHHPDRDGEKSTDRVTLVLDTTSSTAELLVNAGLRQKVLFVGLVTDTGGFKFQHPVSAMRAVLALGLTDEDIEEMSEALRNNLSRGQLESLFMTNLHYFNVEGKSLAVAKMSTTNLQVAWALMDLLRGFDYFAVVQGNGMISLRTKERGVDLSDFAIFYACISGANNPADPNCAD